MDKSEKILSYDELTIETKKMIDLLIELSQRTKVSSEAAIFISQSISIISMWDVLVKNLNVADIEFDRARMLERVFLRDCDVNITKNLH